MTVEARVGVWVEVHTTNHRGLRVTTSVTAGPHGQEFWRAELVPVQEFATSEFEAKQRLADKMTTLLTETP